LPTTSVRKRRTMFLLSSVDITYAPWLDFLGFI
jgi:hypothetical protein